MTTRNDTISRAIAQYGSQAIRDQRAAWEYDRTMQQQAIQQLAGGNQAFGRPQSQQYLDFRAGSMPTDYPLSFTRGDGNYNGWDTQTMMLAELEGTAEQMRQHERDQAGAIQQLAGSRLDGIENYVDDNLVDLPYTSMGRFTPEARGGHSTIAGSVQDPNLDMGARFAQGAMDLANQQQTVRGPRDSEHPDGIYEVGQTPLINYDDLQRDKATNQELMDWRDQSSQQWLDAGNFAEDIQNAPLRDYQLRAAAMLGIDPSIAAGLYPEASVLDDYKDQRDLESLNNYGLPYDEYQSMLNQMAGDQADAEAAYTDDQTRAMSDQVAEQYGIDGNALASEVQLTLPQLYSVLNSQTFTDAASQLDERVATAGLDADFLDEIVQGVRTDPALARTLLTLYSPYLPAED